MRQLLIWCGMAALLLSAVPRASAQVRAPHRQCIFQSPTLRLQESIAAKGVWHANLKRDEALIHPSKAYSGIWLRDSFWSFLGLDNPTLARLALGHFAGRQLPSGQVPTQFTYFVRKPIYNADESTLLYLIWADWQARQDAPITDTARLRLALSYVRSQARAGTYLSAPGSYASWFDGFKLPARDTLSYNQGLYVVALLSAKRLGLGVSQHEIATATAGYRALAGGRGGYLRFSRNLAYHDISGLVGDFLAIWLFQQPLLSNAEVRATLHSQPAFESGFKVVTGEHGKTLSPRAFVSYFSPGDYQNGGSWLLFDYIALADGCLHGVPGMDARMAARLRLEFRRDTVFHEYLNTNSRSRLFKREPAFRDTFSWDTFILRVDAMLAGAE